MERTLMRIERKLKAFFAERPIVNGVLVIDKEDIDGKIVVSSLLSLGMVSNITFIKVDPDAPEAQTPAVSEGYNLRVTF